MNEPRTPRTEHAPCVSSDRQEFTSRMYCSEMAVLKVVVLLAFCWIGADGCSWMRSNFHVTSNSSILHLQRACSAAGQQGRMSLEFPNRLYSQVTQLQAKDHVVFILRSLKSVMKVFSGKYERADCDQQKLQRFMLDIHRQTTELEHCATKLVATEVNKKITKKMEMHFKSLIAHLKNTDYSARGWKEVSEVVLQHLRRLDLLAFKTKEQSSL